MAYLQQTTDQAATAQSQTFIMTSKSTIQTELLMLFLLTAHPGGSRRVGGEKKLLVERFINVFKAFIPFFP